VLRPVRKALEEIALVLPQTHLQRYLETPCAVLSAMQSTVHRPNSLPQGMIIFFI